MCLFVYIASDQPLDLIPWDQEKPAFNVSELPEDWSSVRKQFALPNVYVANSHEGCGCGFQYGEYPQFEDEERHLKRASLNSFSEYLSHQVGQGKRIDAYACWDGEQSETQTSKRQIRVDELRSETFYFRQKEFLHFSN